MTAAEHCAFLINQAVADIVCVARQEGHLVLDQEGACAVFHSLEFQRLVNLFGVVGFGSQAPVWTNQTVDAEVAVVRNVTEVTAVGPIIYSATALSQKTLVFEVPDKLTGQTWIFLIEVIHVTHIAHRVAHRVAVLTLDMRLLATLALARRTNPVDGLVASVHRARHIGIVAVALVMGQSRLVKGFYGIRHILEVVPVARLIAERPDENADVVAEPTNVVRRTLNHGVAEFVNRRQFLIGMAFHIGFCQNIQTIFVA